MSEIELQPNFVRIVTETFPGGAEWLASLPQTLAKRCHDWELTLLPAYPDLSYHFVAPVLRSDGSSAVLKVGVSHDELRLQIETLQLYHGQGMVRLLKADADAGAMLLERLTPGVTLWSLCSERRDAELTRIAATVMRDLKRPIVHPEAVALPTMERWMQGLKRLRTHYDGGTGVFSQGLVETAEYFATELPKSAPTSVLLHGDLHHGNLLSGSRDGIEQWLAIDPKGVLGDPAFEPAAFLHNPFPLLAQYSDPQRALETRLNIFAEILEIERERIRGWAIAYAVLRVWWSIEETDKVDGDSLLGAEWLAETAS